MFAMCWKCAANEHRPVDTLATSRMKVECRDNPEIEDVADAQTKCPLLQEDELTKPESGV